ncbi:MAG: Gldg family protein [Gemmatimonadota bacterium]|nr:Gldg family protein [Gemmatimonadota bacterium]MDH3422734.1 Gldg family protein [Gemmatimonadota bacterium]
MRGAWTVARREVRGYFDQSTAYVLIVAFLGLTLFLAFRTMYAMGVASLRPIFDLLPILFAIFVPAVTMRTLAEERRSKTLEWLLAQPLTESEVVVGKFLGDWLFVMLALAGTLPTAIGVLLVSEADAGVILAQYIGAGLLAAQFVALGLWASSFTRNQITAFIVAAAVAFALFLIGLPIVQIGVPPAVAGALARLSVLSHFENVARGVVDLRDVLYFASTTALFLMLALFSIQRDRLSHGRPEWTRMRVGTAVVTLLVLMTNLLGSYVRGRIDLTSGNLYTLEQGTRDLLGDLDDLVQVKLFASSELPPELQLQLRDVRDLLADMRRASNGNLVVTDVDPDESEEAEEEASQLGIYPVEFNVLRDDQFEVRRGYYGLAVVYADASDVTPVIERTDDLEFRLASAIYDMTTTERSGIAFVEGYGAKQSTDIPGLAQSLGDRYTMRSVNIGGDSAAAINRDSTEVIVVAGPLEPLDSMAARRVIDFVDAGGAALILVEPVRIDAQSPTPLPLTNGLEDLMARRGITVSRRLVLDLASSERVNMGRQGMFQVIAPYPLWPIALPATRHALTSGLNSLSMGWVGELEVSDSMNVLPLWRTTESAGLHGVGAPLLPDQDWNVPPEELRVRVLAAAVVPPEGDARGRMIVVGDASFVEPQFMQQNPSNLTFLANAIDWLARDEALIGIRSKNRTPPNLVFESDMSRNVLKWGNLLGVPLLFVLLGMVRVTGRRRRAEARWGEVIS